MSSTLLVTIARPEDAEAANASGAAPLARYPNGLLVLANEEQRARLAAAGLELTELGQPLVQVTGTVFDMPSAMAADAAAPVDTAPDRIAYYLVQALGPIAGAWQDEVRALGGVVHATLPGFTLLVGLLPAKTAELQRRPWVQALTSYRPAMKVSPKLRPAAEARLDLPALNALELPAGGEPQTVEINVFPGESAVAVAAAVRAQGGQVLSETPRAVVATLPPPTVAAMAARQDVQAILPFGLPELTNNQATPVIGVPDDRVFGTLTLRGAGQIVAIADSGLDTGVAGTVHTDINGRVAAITSWPTNLIFAPFTNDPPANDDGAADLNSGHGTHVAGSVLGNGAAALATGDPTVPMGTAPESQVYFQAIEQAVNWKSAAQLAAEGLAPFTPAWPPRRASLYGLPDNLTTLFEAAYLAGARIHTNSWGSPVAGVYNASARDVDTSMWNRRDLLILFSAGNSGVDSDSNGQIDPDSIGAPGTAKNCVTVGASENNRPAGSLPTPGRNGPWPTFAPSGHVSDNVNGMAPFSSRGPTDDARIKPDVVAPGTNLLSVRSSVFAGPGAPLWGDVAPPHPLAGLYCWSGGTSMSTPLVAGAAALIRQHLVQQRGHVQAGVKPSGALIKAFLVNGATPLPGQFAGEVPPGSGPNNVAGFGRVDLSASLTPGDLQQTLFADEPDLAVESMQIRTFEVQAIDLTRPLKITLVWTDAPSLAGVGGIQNQLYLQVRDPGGAVLDGDVSAFPNVSNNVQRVVIAAPVAGTYEIRVRGVSVTVQAPGASGGANPRQDFALAVANAIGLSVQPVSIAQTIDTTGSMGFFGYMEPAKERARQLVDFMRINDKVALSEFSQRPALPLARTPYPLRLLSSFVPDWSDAHIALGGLIADGMTPIGAGLQEAWVQLAAEPTARPRAIVLLSDGLNNVAPNPLSVLAGIPSDVPIFCIALGPAGSTATLQSIALSRPNGAYFEVGSDEDIFKLHAIYAAVQALAAGATPIGLSSITIDQGAEQHFELPVEPGVAEVSFSLSWEGRPKALALSVLGPDGRRYDASAAATVERLGPTHHLVRVAVPVPGTWTLLVQSQAQQPVRCVLGGAATTGLRLVAEASSVVQAGRELQLGALLLRDGKPWDEAQVLARITLPTRSRREVLARFGTQITQIELPKAVDEPGLSEADRLQLRLAIFAQRAGPGGGGIFRRTSVDLPLTPQGEGRWSGRLPIAVDGSASIELIASGTIAGLPWQRLASLSAQLVPQAAGRAGLRVDDVRVSRRGARAVISALVTDATVVAYPREGTNVTAHLGGDTNGLLKMRYVSRTRRYSVSSPLAAGRHTIEIRAAQQEEVASNVIEVEI